MSEKKKDSEKKADRRPKGELELVMTRWTALSGTAKAASLREQELEKRFSQAMIREAKSFAVFADTEYERKQSGSLGARVFFPPCGILQRSWIPGFGWMCGAFPSARRPWKSAKFWI